MDSQKMGDYNSLFEPIYQSSEREIEELEIWNPNIGACLREIRQTQKQLEREYNSTVIDVAGKKFYMNMLLQQTLDHFIKSAKQKWDFVLVITGIEGSAKTTLAKCIGWYLTKRYREKNSFTNENIIFTASQFYKAVDNADPGSCIIWDEFVMAGMSTDMGAVQNAIIKKFTMIRKKQLFIILVIPFIWMLRSYFAIARTKLLINVYSPDFIKRGYYAVWGYNRKKHLYFRGQMSSTKWSYKSVQPSFRGNFLKDIAQPNFFTDDEEYEKKKDEATKKIGVGKTKEELLLEKEKLKTKQKEKQGFKTTRSCPNCKTREVYYFADKKITKCKACKSILPT